MDRRSFITALIGGMAAASLGGIAVAEAAQPKLTPVPEGDMPIAPATGKALDETDAEFSQYYYRRRRYRRYPRRGYYRRRRYDRRARTRSQR